MKILTLLILLCVCSLSYAEEYCKHDFKQLGKGVWMCRKCSSYYGEPAVTQRERDKELESMKGTIDKIFSMVADLEEKFMGNDRMEQIAMPEHYEAVHIPEKFKKK